MVYELGIMARWYMNQGWWLGVYELGMMARWYMNQGWWLGGL